MIQYLVLGMLFVGCLLQMLAAFGLLTLPGLLGRLHGASKASTLGLICVLMAAMIDKSDQEATLKALILIVFVFITSPLVAQVFASAYLKHNPKETTKLKQNLKPLKEVSHENTH